AKATSSQWMVLKNYRRTFAPNPHKQTLDLFSPLEPKTSASCQTVKLRLLIGWSASAKTITPCIYFRPTAISTCSWGRVRQRIHFPSSSQHLTDPRTRRRCMAIPHRLNKQAGRYSLVDGIPFQLPIYCKNSPCLMAAFSINAEKARELLPGNEIYPLSLCNKGVLLITVIDYRDTVIGKYIEYSIAIACTHGPNPAPRFLPALLTQNYGSGQYVYDLPVSTEISVKGGKGIWGMPKHQAHLDFEVTERTVVSRYGLDGER